MELDKRTKEFFELVQKTAEYKGIPEAAAAKDFLICKILYHLAVSAYAGHCVFKGGTSLSKCYPGSIERFSEDIDLTYLPDKNLKKKELSRELKSVESLLIGDCESQPVSEERNDRNKSSRVWLPRMPENTGIKLEIGAVVRPEPYAMHPVKSYMQEFLEYRQFDDVIEEYQLHEFYVNVLDIRRTFIDKLLAVKRHALCGTLENKVRHIYDVKKLMDRKDIRDFLQDKEQLKRILELTKETDIEYLEKRHSAIGYNPLGPFDYERWKDVLLKPEIKKRYENLHLDLLYTSKQQPFSEALEAFEEVHDILSDIGE
mgnify:CR=1 FL=1